MKKTTKTIFIVFSITLLALLAGLFYMQQNNRHSQLQLLAAQRKSTADSLELADNALFREKIRQILKARKVEADSMTVQDSTLSNMLEQYLMSIDLQSNLDKASNIRLQKTTDSLKNNVKRLEEDKEQVNEELDFAQFQLKELEKSMLSLSAAYGHVTDSLQTLLTNVKQQLQQATIDTLRLPSPKGVTLTYYGKVQDNRPKGFGIGFYEGMGYFIGEWDGVNRNGYGRHFYKNGDRYEGFFENDLRAGYGAYYYASGETYKGEWKNDLMDGKGEIITKEGKTFSGNWNKGKRAVDSASRQ